MLHKRSKGIFILTQLKTYLLSLRRVIFARLEADKEVTLVKNVPVLRIEIHIVVLAVLALLACLLAIIPIQSDAVAIPEFIFHSLKKVPHRCEATKIYN